jgi:hypothetical protein
MSTGIYHKNIKPIGWAFYPTQKWQIHGEIAHENTLYYEKCQTTDFQFLLSTY